MRRSVEIVVVVPIGPTCRIDFVLDTIESIAQYVRCSKQIIVMDDSQDPENERAIKAHYPDAIVLANKRNHGKGTGLYTSLSNTYAYALDHFDFKALLRLDSDALMIDYGADQQILEYFKNNPDVGLAGTFNRGNLTVDEFGNVWDAYGGRGLVIAIAKVLNRYFLRHPFAFWKIRKRLFKALDLGYEFGDLVFGGAYTFSRAGLENLRKEGLLPIKNIMGVGFEEDHLFSLLIKSVNMDLGSLGTTTFTCVWKGMPASPKTLWRAKKKIIHSTKYFKELTEEDIRAFFKEKRALHVEEYAGDFGSLN